MLCHVLPDPAANNCAYQRLGYSVPLGQYGPTELSAVRLEQRPDLDDLGLGKLRRRMSLARSVGSVELLVGLVLGWRAIGEIANAAVGFVAVQMATDMPFRYRPDKVRGDQAMDQEALRGLPVP